MLQVPNSTDFCHETLRSFSDVLLSEVFHFACARSRRGISVSADQKNVATQTSSVLLSISFLFDFQSTHHCSCHMLNGNSLEL